MNDYEDDSDLGAYDDPEVPAPPPAPKVTAQPAASTPTGPQQERSRAMPVDPQAVDRDAPTIGAGRVPPHDLDAEAAVLSVIMLRGGEALDDLEDHLSASEMYSEAHKRIYEAAHELHTHGHPVDSLTMSAFLKDHDRYRQVGGFEYFTQIINSAPAVSTRHLLAYAKRVRDRARLRNLLKVMQEAVARVYVGIPDRDHGAFFDGIEREVQTICAQRHTGGLQPVGPMISSMMTKLEENSKRETGTVGVSTGFTEVDKWTGGLFDADLTIIGARPGMGKTSYILGVCTNVSKRDMATIVFELEMPEEQLAQRLVAAEALVNVLAVRSARLTPEDWSRMTYAASLLHNLEIHIDVTPGISIQELAAKARRKVAELRRKGKKIGAIIVDYLTLMKMRNPDKLVQSIGEITIGLKNLAKELDVPVVCLAQLNRAVENRQDKRPQMNDLRDSGAIEQDADNIEFLYRDDYYNEGSNEPGVVELIIAKQRNGPTGTVKLGFAKQSTTFMNLDRYATSP